MMNNSSFGEEHWYSEENYEISGFFIDLYTGNFLNMNSKLEVCVVHSNYTVVIAKNILNY